MSDRITFSRLPDGSYNLSESKLSPLVDRLYERSSEPRIPQSLMTAASRELVSNIHRVASGRGLDFTRAAGLLVNERPALFRLTRCSAVHDGDRLTDLEIT